MIESLRQRRIALFVCVTLAFVMLSLSLVGCRGRKTESAYGPGNEWRDDMRKRIPKEVDDPDKVAGLLSVVDKIEVTLVEMDGDVKRYYASLAELDRDYNSTPEEFQDTIDQFNIKRNTYFETMLGYVFEMKDIAGREDWEAVADIDETLYESWQRPFEL